MRYYFMILVLGLASAADFSLRKKGRPSASVTTSTPDIDDTEDTEDTEDDAYMSLVKAYIEAGTCDEVSTGSLCGEEATSYYKEFEYLGQKVIITNSIPDHEAETDAVSPNPNTRLEVG